MFLKHHHTDALVSALAALARQRALTEARILGWITRRRYKKLKQALVAQNLAVQALLAEAEDGASKAERMRTLAAEDVRLAKERSFVKQLRLEAIAAAAAEEEEEEARR